MPNFQDLIIIFDYLNAEDLEIEKLFFYVLKNSFGIQVADAFAWLFCRYRKGDLKGELLNLVETLFFQALKNGLVSNMSYLDTELYLKSFSNS